MFSGYGTSPATRFDKVACDLSDVLGTPGLSDGAAAADRVGHALGHGFESVSGDGGLYLRSAAVGGVAAFGPPREALAHTSDAVDALLAQPAAANRVITEVTSPSGVHQLRVQLVAGRRVVGGCYRLHAAPTGQVVVTGYPVAGVAGRDPGPVPRRRRATVADAMRAQLSLPAGIELQIETVLFPLEGDAVWAYLGRGVLWDDVVADLRIIVRGDDLSLLVSRDAAMSATWGEGLVYASNPARNGRPAAVRLSDLDGDGAVLRSRLVDVAPTSGGRPQRPLRDWRLDVGDPGFDDVSAYHHLTQAANWFASIVGPDVFSGSPFSPLRVVTGDRATRDWVARFLPSLATIVFGDGDLPGARCADICVHELTHAVVWGARQIDEIGPIEARGLNEGYADYAQASFLANPRFGDWVRPAQFRDCSSADIRFPVNPAATSDPYAIGSAWAAVLWDLHEAIGAGVADALALDTIFYLEETSTLSAARAALLASDAQLFPAGDRGGRHADAITTAYDRRIP